jgi:hypothetical protein
LNPEFLTGSSFKEKRQGQDFYPTPDHATLSLLANETFTGSIWEPACGDGAISKLLLTQYPAIYSSDLHDWQYGETGVDFLSSHRRTHNVVTNPPYKLAQEFVEHALAVSEHKVAMLLKLNFLEGQRRKSMFAKTPLKQSTCSPNGSVLHARGKTARATVCWPTRGSFGTNSTRLRRLWLGFNSPQCR